MNFLSALRAHFAGRVLLLLGATALQALLAVLVLPFTTLRLGAADFGYFALIMSVIGFANAIGDGGGALVLPAHYGAAPNSERRKMLASFFVVSAALSMALAVLFLLFWPVLSLHLIGSDRGTYAWMTEILAALVIPLRSMTTLATTVFSVSGRGNAIAAQVAVQAVGNFAGTLLCLFGLELGPTALFAGVVTGQLASLSVAAIALGAQPWSQPSARWLAVVGRHAPTAAFAGLADGVRGIGENAVLAANLGVSSVGYYSHARLYYGMLMSATNAIAHNLWATSLAEARDESSGFHRTNAVWKVVHILITLFGVGFVCFGREFIVLLTHDRLTPAASLVPWLAVLALVHLSGRGQNALVYARGAGPEVARTRATIVLLVLMALPLLVGAVGNIGINLGITGFFGVLITEAAVFRFYLRWKAASFRRSVDFADQWAIVGIVLTILAWLLNAVISPGLMIRSVMFLVVFTGILVSEWRLFKGWWSFFGSCASVNPHARD